MTASPVGPAPPPEAEAAIRWGAPDVCDFCGRAKGDHPHLRYFTGQRGRKPVACLMCVTTMVAMTREEVRKNRPAPPPWPQPLGSD
ncbi:MAG: hypothetical protein VW338_00865 [Rhodospirillaceae bacterium]